MAVFDLVEEPVAAVLYLMEVETKIIKRRDPEKGKKKKTTVQKYEGGEVHKGGLETLKGMQGMATVIRKVKRG